MTIESLASCQWIFVLCVLMGAVLGAPLAGAGEPARPVMRVVATDSDFVVTGRGSSKAWNVVQWTTLTRRPGGVHDYTTRVKMLYSKTGLYVLMDATDRLLTATIKDDFANLWTEDVFEFFLWPDERWPIYFEYEISPLGQELPILVPNFDGHYFGWQPWHYDGARRTQKAVSIQGGARKPGAAIQGWRAEVYVPFDLLKPLQNVPPRPGTRWRANFYRIDYDDGKTTSWDWARVGPSFHDYQNYGTLVFAPSAASGRDGQHQESSEAGTEP
jgi:hypothetical protein